MGLGVSSNHLFVGEHNSIHSRWVLLRRLALMLIQFRFIFFWLPLIFLWCPTLLVPKLLCAYLLGHLVVITYDITQNTHRVSNFIISIAKETRSSQASCKMLAACLCAVEMVATCFIFVSLMSSLPSGGRVYIWYLPPLFSPILLHIR